jgi:hypothetical protein
MTILKIPYEILIRYSPSGEYQGAHQIFREVILDENGVLIAERLLPATPFGSDPDFPPSVLLGMVTSDALTEANLKAAALSAAELVRDAAVVKRDAAIAERDAAIAEKAAAVAAAEDAIAQLQSQISALTAQPERPPGKWWKNSSKFLEEFTADELLSIHTSQVPLVVQLLMTLLAWTDEVWSSDQRIIMGLQALVSLKVLTPERSAAILAE